MLESMFNAIDSRIINLCPMALCDTILSDIGVSCPDTLLTGIGLATFSISTYDDLVDELPRDQLAIAGLIYAGSISTLEGIRLLIQNGYEEITPIVIDCINRNHYHQTKIVETLWKKPHDEKGYLDAICHTGYWVAIGLNAAIAYAKRSDLQSFVDEFSMCYGLACQIFDDMREIDDDLENKYWPLPISIAIKQGLDLSIPINRNIAIRRPHELAMEYLQKANELCQDSFPKLLGLTTKIKKIGSSITD